MTYFVDDAGVYAFQDDVGTLSFVDDAGVYILAWTRVNVSV
jgi:hypothetical protein